MPKYRNIQSFIQPVVVNGKRYIVKPGEVLYSERELDLTIYTFLKLANETDPISQIDSAPVRQIGGLAKTGDIVELQAKVDVIIKEFNNLVKPDSLQNFVSRDELNKKLKAVTDSILEQTPQIEQSEFDSMGTRVEELKHMYDELKNDEGIKTAIQSLTDLKANQELILKRLEIMKNAVEVVNQALHNLENEVYLHGSIVVLDDEEKEK